jgi:hypothetical protein
MAVVFRAGDGVRSVVLAAEINGGADIDSFVPQS